MIRSARDNYFLELIYANDSYIWFLEKDMQETQSTVVRYNLLTGSSEIMLHMKHRIDKAVFEKSKLLCLYQWNGESEMIDMYNMQGNIIATIDYSELMKENEDIELDDIVSLLEGRYVIFGATDYSNDDSYQCRVVYDIINKEFVIYASSFIWYGESVY